MNFCPIHAGINLVLKVQRRKALGSSCCQLTEPGITQEIDFWVCLWGIFKMNWTGMGRLTLNVWDNISWLHRNDFYFSILLFPLTVGALWPATSCSCHLTDCTHKLWSRQPTPPLKLFNLGYLFTMVGKVTNMDRPQTARMFLIYLKKILGAFYSKLHWNLWVFALGLITDLHADTALQFEL